MMVYNSFMVALGGAAGSVARYLFGVMAVRLLGVAFPYGILGVNILGSLLMGIAAAAMVTGHLPGATRLLVVTGFLGGFTTFSAFSLDVFEMLEHGQILSAVGYVVASVVLAVLALLTGYYCARWTMNFMSLT